MIKIYLWNMFLLSFGPSSTVCPRSLVHFYIATYYTKMDNTFLTHSGFRALPKCSQIKKNNQINNIFKFSHMTLILFSIFQSGPELWFGIFWIRMGCVKYLNPDPKKCWKVFFFLRCIFLDCFLVKSEGEKSFIRIVGQDFIFFTY